MKHLEIHAKIATPPQKSTSVRFSCQTRREQIQLMQTKKCRPKKQAKYEKRRGLALDRHVDGGLGILGVLSTPQLGDRLDLRVEADALLAVEVGVSAERSTRTGEGEHG